MEIRILDLAWMTLMIYLKIKVIKTKAQLHKIRVEKNDSTSQKKKL